MSMQVIETENLDALQRAYDSFVDGVIPKLLPAIDEVSAVAKDVGSSELDKSADATHEVVETFKKQLDEQLSELSRYITNQRKMQEKLNGGN